MSLLAHCLFPEILFDELLQRWLDGFEGRVDILSRLGSRENNFATCEDEETDLGALHVIDESGEGVGIEVAEHLVLALEKPLQLNFEVNRATAHHVLDFEV